MWGSSFSELAKKAQELQVQASEAATSISTSSPGGFFNLDAMQKGDEASKKKETPKPPDHERTVQSSPASASQKLSMDRILPPKPQTASTVRPTGVGKLKVPGSVVSPAVDDATKPKLEKAQQPHQQLHDDKLEEMQQQKDAGDVEGGWDDDDEMDNLDLGVSSNEEEEEELTVQQVVEPTVPKGEDHAVEDGEEETSIGNKNNAADVDKPEPKTTEAVYHDKPERPIVDKDGADAKRTDEVTAKKEILVDKAESVFAEQGQTGVNEAAIGSSFGEASAEGGAEVSQPDNDGSEELPEPEGNDSTGAAKVEGSEEENAEKIDSGASAMEHGQEGSESPAVMDRTIEKEGSESSVIVDLATDSEASTAISDRVFDTSETSCSLPPQSSEKPKLQMSVQSGSDLEMANSEAAVPDEVLEHFSQQMKRLEENYQSERTDIAQRHILELQQLKASFNHDDCEAARRELEESLRVQLGEKEEQLRELLRINEGYKLKLDVLKREVAGTQELLEARDNDMGKANENHLRSLRELEEKASKFQKEAQTMKEELDSTNNGFAALKHEHADLRARVKTVATELKDRRIECRELRAKMEEQNDLNEKVTTDLEKLRFQLSDQDRSGTEKDEEIEQLRSKLDDLTAVLEKAGREAKEREEQAGKVLAEYKRKAQNSLALANSRAAAAIQAKEEAELEARAARSTADSAMERAVKAEISSKEAVAEAKAYVTDMEKEKMQAIKEMRDAKNELNELGARLIKIEGSLEQTELAREKMSEDLQQSTCELRQERSKVSMLQEELRSSHARASVLRDDIATLRDQLQKKEALVAVDAPDIQEEPAKASPDSVSMNIGRAADGDTIEILQEELREANAAIEDLKEALANSVALNEKYERSGAYEERHGEPNGPISHYSNGDSSASTPLFYAMEKQAELKTAREEINRLANLLSNAESEKTEAHESMDSMRRKMEEAESRLKRFEKLSSSGVRVASGNSREDDAGSTTLHDNREAVQNDSSAVNIEYLKNIMLSFLNAKTLAEKKALVPVIGAVLCLTADEQKNALRNVEESGSLGVFESFSSKLM